MSRDIHIDYVPLAELKAWPQNPKRHDLPTLHKSLARFGYINPILLNEATGELLAGHGRVEALAERKARGEPPPDGVRVVDGEWLAPVVRGVSLPSEEAAAYAVVDNRLVELGGWDDAALAEVLRGLAETPAGLDGVGYGEADLAALLASIAAAQPDEREDHPEVVSRADELQAKWHVERGQVWLCGRHRVMCGDSTNADDIARLMQGEKAGAIIADPPYGMRLDTDYSGMINTKGLFHAKGLTHGRKYEQVIGDDEDFDPRPIIQAFGNVAEQFWFGADYYASRLPDTEHSGAWLVWDKRLDESADKMFGSCFELIWSRRKCRREMLRHKWAGVFGTENESPRGRQHPNQKPVILLVDLVSRTSDIVLDPFLGSGTTLIAAEKLGRICYGMEIHPPYVSVVLQRYLAFTGDMPRLADA